LGTLGNTKIAHYTQLRVSFSIGVTVVIFGV
jgi:hypothetical protein